MWEKRVRGYLAMGYKIGDSQQNVDQPLFFNRRNWSIRTTSDKIVSLFFPFYTNP